MKLLIKLTRTIEVNGHERIISKGNEWYVKTLDKDFHTTDGIIPKEVLAKPGRHVIGKETYYVVDAQPTDYYRARKQEVQKISLKDLGFISAYIGLHKDMHVAEAGTGSGGATAYFSPLVKHVTSYDIRDVPANKELKKLPNVTLKQGDVTKKEDVDCSDVDVFLLDVPQPWEAWESMECVKAGGWVVGYTPSTNQLQQLVNSAPEHFYKVHSCEVIERHWRVKGLVCRPETADHSHTAFLSFFRKLE